MSRQPHAHRFDDRPPVTADDVRNGLFLILFILILVGICAVDPTQMAAPR